MSALHNSSGAKSGLIFEIARASYVDGPGIRTTFFMKGCHMRCQWCHNPEGQGFTQEMMFFRDKCVNCGNCKKVCPHPDGCRLCGACEEVCSGDARRIAGRRVTPEELLQIALQDIAYYKSSGGGVTFSGGEAMLQADFLRDTLPLMKENGISTAVDTAGDVDFSEFEKINPFTDWFLYDIKCIDEEKHRRFTGVSNCRILENYQRLLKMVPEKLILRIPVIPGFNGDEEEMRRIAAYLAPGHLKPELLPYHPMGEGKAIAVGKESTRFRIPTGEEMNFFRSLF